MALVHRRIGEGNNVRNCSATKHLVASRPCCHGGLAEGLGPKAPAFQLRAILPDWCRIRDGGDANVLRLAKDGRVMDVRKDFSLCKKRRRIRQPGEPMMPLPPKVTDSLLHLIPFGPPTPNYESRFWLLTDPGSPDRAPSSVLKILRMTTSPEGFLRLLVVTQRECQLPCLRTRIMRVLLEVTERRHEHFSESRVRA